MSSTIKVDNLVNQSGDNDSGLDLSTNDQVIIKTANTTALTVDASQNVGIGKTAPLSKLDVTGGFITVSKDANTAGRIGASEYITGSTANDLVIQATGSGATKFYQVGVNSLNIDSSGNVFIGTTALPSGGGGFVGFEIASSGRAILQCGTTVTSSETLQRYYNPNGSVGSITVSGSATAFNTSSDHRLKENVTADWDATTRLKQLNPVRFNFIADADTTVDGFLAHEVQSVVSEAITGTHNQVEVWKDGEELPDGVSVGDNKLDEDGNTIPVYQGIDQSKLVPLLVKTIQELEARITALENAE